MPAETGSKEILLRLKRKFGREKARQARWANNESVVSSSRERCAYEANVWSLAMGMVDQELRKLDEELP